MHMTHIMHTRDGCNFEELHGIRMFEVPPLLLGNEQRQVHYPRTCFATFKQWRVTHYPRVIKKKKENKQGFSCKLTQQITKGYCLCGVHPGFLP